LGKLPYNRFHSLEWVKIHIGTSIGTILELNGQNYQNYLQKYVLNFLGNHFLKNICIEKKLNLTNLVL